MKCWLEWSWVGAGLCENSEQISRNALASGYLRPFR